MKLLNLIKKRLFKKHREFTGDYLVDYYNTHDEDVRLLSKHGRVERYASKCGLSTSEYVTKRALGFAPRTVLPDAFLNFYGKLCEICNSDMTPETEAKLLTLIDEIHSEILSPKKEVNDLLLPQDSGP